MNPIRSFKTAILAGVFSVLATAAMAQDACLTSQAGALPADSKALLEKE